MFPIVVLINNKNTAYSQSFKIYARKGATSNVVHAAKEKKVERLNLSQGTRFQGHETKHGTKSEPRRDRRNVTQKPDKASQEGAPKREKEKERERERENEDEVIMNKLL